MKNLIGNLLLAIEFFAHFCEGSSSSYRSSQQPWYRFDPDENTIKLTSRGRDIEVVRSTFGGTNPISVPKACTLLGHPRPRGIPTLANKGNENFQTVPVIGSVDHVKYCVIYLTEYEEVLGVKAPPTDQEAARDQYNEFLDDEQPPSSEVQTSQDIQAEYLEKTRF
ncbi:uncharacterized protein LOC117173243 [Belonocnema kinseyi]|uniref:uncharacterized protein LOC117173243 n=1 Tax=Belonocnema kinseyi TaxID=2817044 RepID=UPI00143D2360|nr:uncharacterized protein LOC117173243 [Belonocnema kinseyi]